DHFTYSKLFRFVLPSIVMMTFSSVYSVVDGFFVSNYVGKIPFSAINLIYPFWMILGALGFMMGTGGAAIVGKTLGEGRHEDANRYFSLIVYVTMGIGITFGTIGAVFAPQVSKFLGAEGELLQNCIIYGRIVLMCLPLYMLQYLFQSFCVTAEKPKLGLTFTIAAGCTNIVLDALFIRVLDLGIAGAALATGIGQFIGGVFPIIYFARKNSSLLKLGKTNFYGKVLLKTCTNGSSEFMVNAAASVVVMLYNFQLLRLVGEDGVAAYGAIGYIAFFFIAILWGYSVGCAPITSFNFGAQNYDELKNILRKSLRINAIGGITLMIVSILAARVLASIFVGYDPSLCDMTVHGMRIYSISFILAGINIFGSSFFTALNNGLISATISFLRTLVFECGSVMLIPYLFELAGFNALDGLWGCIIIAELAAVTVTSIFLVKKRHQYHYA
ncbi:MAG: MATE family efflux transporter, partial [Firmicutes bacterium]|nr:MATE family efflux transporter [Bacillota bacterium]